MSETALRQRLAKLTNLDKLQSFIQVPLLRVPCSARQRHSPVPDRRPW